MTRQEYDKLKEAIHIRRGMMSSAHQMMDIKEWWVLGASDDILPFIYQDLKHTVESGGKVWEDQRFSWVFIPWLDETFPNANPIKKEHYGSYLDIAKDWFNWLNENSKDLVCN